MYKKKKALKGDGRNKAEPEAVTPSAEISMTTDCPFRAERG